MKREKVVELMLHCKKMVELNKESIRMQEKLPNKGIAQYLEGVNAAYDWVYGYLSKES